MSPVSAVKEFAGFPTGTFDFLRGLAEHNDKAWFEAHRGEYTALWVEPALAFIEAIGPRLVAEVSPRLHFEAKINGSLFRINRDVRFSVDKSPYKTNLDMWFWEGDRKGWEAPGLFIRLQPEALYLGAGIHHLSPAGLMAYREAVVDERRGRAFAELAETIETTGPYQVGADQRKSVPRGYSASHDRARFLLYEGLHAMLEASPLPREIGSAAFVDYCVGHFKAVSSINDWLREVVA